MTDTATSAVAESDDRQPTPDATRRDNVTVAQWLRHPAVLIGGLVLVAGVIPLAVALANLREPQWYPAMDQALIELRVRDVGEGHPPLIGLMGRVYGYGQLGSHPGPLMFWCLYPVYWLFGGTAWALQVATASLNVLAMSAAIWIGYRRGGRAAAVGIAVIVVLLARSYGIEKLTMVWNPYIQVLWWVVFLLAVWSVLCDDLAALPLAVFAGTFCLQAEYPYLGLVAVLGGLAAIAVGLSAVRRRADTDSRRRRELVRWVLASGGLLGLLWVPPLVEELTTRPGNLNVLRDSILNPSNADLITGLEPSLGRTAELWLAHLNVGTLLSHTLDSMVPAPDVPNVPGLVLLGVWITATAVAWRRLPSALRRLHLTVAAALVAGFASIHGIPGDTWDYLVLWAWGTTSLLVAATILTLATLAMSAPVIRGHRWISTPWPSQLRPTVGGLAIVLVVVSVAFTYDATQARYGYAVPQSEMISEVAPSTIAALSRGDLAGNGDGRYLVLWNQDSWWSGMAGFGFYDELDRQGFNVGVTDDLAISAGGEHRVLDRADADGVIHLVIGPHYIDRWDATPGAVRVAYHDPRSEQEVTEYERLEREVKAIFREHGRPDLARSIDRSLYLTILGQRPPETDFQLQRMLSLGLPAAVFVSPVDVEPDLTPDK